MIEKAIYQLLLSDSDVSAIAGDRISVDLAEDVTGPYLVFFLVGGTNPLFLDGSAGQSRARVQVDAYAQGAEQVRKLAAAVIALFHGKSVQSEGYKIQLSELVQGPKSSYESETGLRRQMMEFQFFFD